MEFSAPELDSAAAPQAAESSMIDGDEVRCHL